MKKIIVFCLAICLVFALSVSASATNIRDVYTGVKVRSVNLDDVYIDFFDWVDEFEWSDNASFIIIGNNLYFVSGHIISDNGKIVVQHPDGVGNDVIVIMYTYDAQLNVFNYTAEDSWSSGSMLTSNLAQVKWSYSDIIDLNTAEIVFEGEQLFHTVPPTYEDVVDEALQTTYMDILSVVRVLAGVGVGILSIFLALNLLKKKNILHI